MKSGSAIPKSVRNSVWITYCGRKFDGVCWCCKAENISVFNFHCGHVVSRKDGGECTVDNLRPICQACNMSMGAINMDLFMRTHFVSLRSVGDTQMPQQTPQQTPNRQPEDNLSRRLITEQMLTRQKRCVRVINGAYCEREYTVDNLLRQCGECNKKV